MHRSLLITVFILLSTVGTLVTAEKNDHTKISSNTAPGGSTHGRVLRGASTILADPTDSEEKTLLSPSITSRITKWRIKAWIATKRSDDYVLGALKISGLTGTQLKENSKFKIFQEFQVARWLKGKLATPTSTVMKELKLQGLSGDALTAADGYSTYVKYVMALEKNLDNYDIKDWSKLFKGVTPELFQVSEQVMALKRNFIQLRAMGFNPKYVV
ncbi:Avirulence protein [Phytophthora megakarya]|uniref:Avirulence protein n=1 Tax=Phytophthora megakarya TaxID=4795 RepID=A0A225WEX1_9STRA|nr:Avirulence protein [Phytophthora megakarya]